MQYTSVRGLALHFWLLVFIGSLKKSSTWWHYVCVLDLFADLSRLQGHKCLRYSVLGGLSRYLWVIENLYDQLKRVKLLLVGNEILHLAAQVDDPILKGLNFDDELVLNVLS